MNSAGAITIPVRVHAITYEAVGILSFEFRPLAGGDLPAFTAGAHFDVLMPGGAQRSYSLINPPTETGRYVIAVNRDPESRGGSSFLCEKVRPGDVLEITPPSNSFALVEAAERSVFIAGGIGITPLWCMIQHLEVLGRPWRLYYAARTRAKTAFLTYLERLEAVDPGRVVLTFDHEPGYAMLDLTEVIAEQPPGTHFYCCGPVGMLKAFEAAAEDRDPDQIHVEYFSASQPVAAGGFEVVLARSGAAIWIPPDKTILEMLLAAGHIVPHSCTEGVCGTCETIVLEGLPDHRDNVLSKRERASNKKIMICRSGCLGQRLVLDL